MDNILHFQETTYGFEWGPMKIERHISHKGYVILGLKTNKCNFDIYVTPSGMVKILVPQGQSLTVIGGRKRK
jgi:hypothetical protein